MLGKAPKTSVTEVERKLVADGHDVSWSHGSAQLEVRRGRKTAVVRRLVPFVNSLSVVFCSRCFF